MKPVLFGTPLSHFTRKVRVLFAELGVDFDFVRTPGVLGTAPEAYGANPLLRVPTLVVGDTTMIESDAIARYVVATWDPSDRFRVRSDDVRDTNRMAVINGVMANEVVLILAKRGGLADVDKVTYFQKLALANDRSLAWLDRDVDPDAEAFDYRDIALVCLWQHLEHYDLIPGLAAHARLAARVARLAERPSFVRTAPAVSLADAAAAGWTPG